MSEEKSIKLNNEQLDAVTGGSKEDKGKDYNMMRCPRCGAPNEVLAKDSITVTCSVCGAQFQT